MRRVSASMEVTVLGRAHAQPLLNRRIEVTDGDAAHRNPLTSSIEIIVIDCVDVNARDIRNGIQRARHKPSY